jgi:hypothetical protein
MKLAYTHLILFVTMSFIDVTAQKNDLTGAKLNDIQVIGSHNSYKIGIEKPMLDYLKAKNAALSSLEYEHIPLTDQLNLGLRSLELDVFHDPDGGHHSNPGGLDIVRASGNTPLPFDEEEKLKAPGLKVFHVQEIDFRSHQLLFKDALMDLKKWSDKNKGHTPIIITMNTKDAKIPQTRDPLVFDAEALKNLDDEIRAIIPQEKLITPDFVRGKRTTLEEAVLKDGWPKLAAVKGKLLFVLDEGDEKLDLYLQKFPQLRGAVLFVNKEEGNPEAAFRIVNDPVADFNKIQSLVKSGYMVRTRADGDTQEARTNDYRRFEKAKASGAQIITTDYYIPGKLFKSDFEVIFEDGSYERIQRR